jgi:DNA topoisomerase-1
MTYVERLSTAGILRRGTKRRGFRYVYARSGKSARAQAVRIDALKVPPAWRDVAVNPSPRADLQAVGRDARGRWQYIYNPKRVRHRERQKFRRILRFGAALPKLRAAVSRDLRKPAMPRDKVLAAMVRILSFAFIRPGSEAYAAENGSYGIATLRRKHVRVKRDVIHFKFVAKSGKVQQAELRNRMLAGFVRRQLALPGYEVFKYVDDAGAVVDVRRADITEYIHRNMGERFSAKDFRTWAATVICAIELARNDTGADASTKELRRCVVHAVKKTAEQLGNTPAICRSSYISPSVITAFESGKSIRGRAGANALPSRGLSRAERAVMSLLKNGH